MLFSMATMQAGNRPGSDPTFSEPYPHGFAMVRVKNLVALLAVAMLSPVLAGASCGDNADTSNPSTPRTVTPPTHKDVMEAWKAFLGADAGNVTLLAFDGTILERVSAVSLRKSVMPLHLHRGAVMKYASAEFWQTFSENSEEPWGIIQIEGMIEGTLADIEGPHLLTANLHNMFMKVSWDVCGTYTICLVTAGYIKNLRSDENYYRWSQDVEALVAGASVTALVTQLYRLAETLSGWNYCPELTSDKARNHWKPF